MIIDYSPSAAMNGIGGGQRHPPSSSTTIMDLEETARNLTTSTDAMRIKLIQIFISAVSSVKTLSLYMCPIISTATTNSAASNCQIDPSVMGTVECYSCMSMSYEQNWPILQYVYRPPRTFTDQCNDPLINKRHSIGTINCSNICVTLKEPQFSAGVYLGQKVIRGCLDHLLVHGFNQTAIDTHRFRHFDICRNLKRADLMRPSSNGIPMQGDVQMCACYGDRCNSSAKQLRPSPRLLFFSTTLIFLSMTLLITIWGWPNPLLLLPPVLLLLLHPTAIITFDSTFPSTTTPANCPCRLRERERIHHEMLPPQQTLPPDLSPENRHLKCQPSEGINYDIGPT